jgi:hypothetical protein
VSWSGKKDGCKHKGSRSKRKRECSDGDDDDTVFNGNEDHLSEEAEASSEGEEINSDRNKCKKRSKTGLEVEENYAMDVEKVKDVMQEIRKFWKCPNNEHPTICIPQLDKSGACKTFSITSIRKWAKLVVSNCHSSYYDYDFMFAASED